MLKPSDLINVFPCMSVCGSANAEGLALDIMKLLVETGDEFRELSESESDYFRSTAPYWWPRVKGYCVSEEKAIEFSTYWARIACDKMVPWGFR